MAWRWARWLVSAFSYLVIRVDLCIHGVLMWGPISRRTRSERQRAHDFLFSSLDFLSCVVIT